MFRAIQLTKDMNAPPRFARFDACWLLASDQRHLNHAHTLKVALPSGSKQLPSHKIRHKPSVPSLMSGSSRQYGHTRGDKGAEHVSQTSWMTCI